MGLGYYTSEELRNDEKSGKLLTYSTWNYKPPTTKDIPVQFNIGVLKNAPNPLGVLRSKCKLLLFDGIFLVESFLFVLPF